MSKGKNDNNKQKRGGGNQQSQFGKDPGCPYCHGTRAHGPSGRKHCKRVRS